MPALHCASRNSLNPTPQFKATKVGSVAHSTLQGSTQQRVRDLDVTEEEEPLSVTVPLQPHYVSSEEDRGKEKPTLDKCNNTKEHKGKNTEDEFEGFILSIHPRDTPCRSPLRSIVGQSEDLILSISADLKGKGKAQAVDDEIDEAPPAATICNAALQCFLDPQDMTSFDFGDFDEDLEVDADGESDGDTKQAQKEKRKAKPKATSKQIAKHQRE
ncbi:hypothetical protein EIP86_011461, partial [Pleurotus ostreatoroseus]